VYHWERFDDRGRPLQEPASQQRSEEALPPIPEPRSADEASLLMAQFRPFRRTPEELKRLLEARADPNIVIPTETWGGLCPLAKILMARDAHVPIFSYAGASAPIRLDILPRAPARCTMFRLYSHTCIILGRSDARAAAGVRRHGHKKAAAGLQEMPGGN
jgi:hypothetical protein